MRIKAILYSKRLALYLAGLFLVILAGYGVLARSSQPKPLPQAPVVPLVNASSSGILSNVLLSQSKVLQGSDGEVYLKLTLTPDAAIFKPSSERKPTDFVVVLDRSGSMADQSKMEYAHQAIESLLQQMTEQDRFTLVTFDSIVDSPIRSMSVNKNNRAELVARVRAVVPRGGTNLAEGLLQGAQFLKETQNGAGRVKRLILISDGMANIGVTDPNTIGKMAKNAAGENSAISTIGVGLEYNESLLANIADLGLGNYHYLEKLSDLDKVLAGEFTGASQVVAQDLKLRLTGLGSALLVDASGYPIEKTSTTATIRPGHLYAGQEKVLYLTFRVPTTKLEEYNLGSASLSYSLAGHDELLSVMDNAFKVTCLPPDKSEEVTASVDKNVYGEVWQQNNYGRFLKANAQDLSDGNSQGFLNKLSGYKQKLKDALSIAPSEGLQKQYDELDAMGGTVSNAAPSPEATKSLGKKYHSDGIEAQRKSK